MRRLLLAFGFLLLGPTVHAQEQRQGFWFSVGAGIGSRRLECTACVGSTGETGFAVNIRMGGTPGPQVTLGAALTGWYKSDNRSSGKRFALFSALMGIVQVYPVRGNGFFLQGGPGYIVDVVDDDLVIDAVGMTVGAGYDIRLKPGFSITPQLNYLRTLDSGALTTSLVQVGVAATWH
jgi:hypothetical protein